jgi:outer membrane immunogenic protein
MLKRAGFQIASVVMVISVAAAQDVGHFDASVAWAGVFSKTSTSYGGGVVLKPTNSGAVLGTFRFRFNRMHALEVNIGRTSTSQHYFLGPNDFRVNSDVTEYSGAYVFSPFRTAKLEPFLLGGAGALRFNPGNTYIDGFQSAFGATKQTSLAFLYGGGADYHLWRALSLRLQYRGLVYKAPNFRVQTLVTGAKGHMAEPSIGIVFKF